MNLFGSAALHAIPPAESIPPATAIKFEKVSKAYPLPGGKGTMQALSDFNLEIGRGEFFGLLGPNGAGKTTAINLLCGVARLQEGRIEVMGIDVRAHPEEAKRLLGVVGQEIVADSFFALPRMLRIQSRLSGVAPETDWIDYLIERLALKDHARKTTRELSGGMKRRMMIARALAHRPRILILDEPTAGVDVELRHSMWEFLRELHGLGMTLVLTTHYLEEAEQFCDRIAIMKGGRLLTLKGGRELLDEGGQSHLVAQATGADGKVDELSVPLDSNGFADLMHAEARLAELARARQLQLGDVRIRKPSLEDVFLKLTRQ